jgi:energy-coupling factor transporter ATP-binding protein EcfA2
VHIRRVKIKNVRGFKRVDLDFSRPDGSLAGWTVLAGRNGSGKSTLLRTIALAAAGQDAARALSPSFADWIRAGERQAEVQTQLEFSSFDGSDDLELLPSWARLSWEKASSDIEPALSDSLPTKAYSKGKLKDFDVFISCSHSDLALAYGIIQELQYQGIRPWIDERELIPGMNWRKAISRAIERAPVMVLFIGPRGYSENRQADELAPFLKMNRPVIPVLLPGATPDLVPASLRDFVYVDMRHPNDGALTKLVWGITGENPQAIDKPQEDSLSSHNRQKWFIVGYGPYRRLAGHTLDAQRLMEGPEPISRVASLFREDASLVESIGWLREIYLQRLENKAGTAELEAAVLSLLNDGLLPDNTLIDRIDSDGLWTYQYDVYLPLRELSDGYRTTAALVMDIVRHLHRSFGDLRIETAEDEHGSYQRVDHEGVVLIDEVDLHLHVSWQKRIGFWLKRHFPNIQFIVTTHSPFICQAADPGGLIRLPAPGEDRTVEHVSEDLYNTVVNGSIDDAILTELFGLETPYSLEAERLRDKVTHLEGKLQSGNATDKDRDDLRELRSRLPQTLSTDVAQALRKLVIEG